MTQPSRHSLGLACLVVTAAGWALNWPAVKLLLAVWPPLFSRGVAGVVAALALAALAAAQGERLRVPAGAWPRLLAASFTNVFAWMGFSTMAMQSLSVAQGALLVYTMPIWTTLLGWPLLRARPSARDFLGLALGVAGIAVLLLGGRGAALRPGAAAGIALALAAAICFALGAVLNRRALPLPPVALTAWQVGLGCAPMVVLGLAWEHPALAALTPPALGALAYMTVFPMGICYLTWFTALRHLPAAAASTAMLMVPLLGVIAAAALLGEPFGPRQVIALALTLCGVTLALFRPKKI